MKGIIFTEFLEMVEDRFGWEIAEQIVADAEIESNGIYTSVGTYPHEEMVALVVELTKHTGLSVAQLLMAFGEHAFGRFVIGYPGFFTDQQTSFDFLDTLENHIHVEVLKLYPEAELPHFKHEIVGDTMTLVYESARPLADFAEGLLLGCIKHFGEEIKILRTNLDDTGCKAEFKLVRQTELANA